MRLSDILQMPTHVLTPSLRQVVDAIDALQSFPAITPFPLMITARRKEQGAYVYRSGPSRPVRLEVSREADWAELTLVHEIGHFIDHMVLNPIHRGFGSDHDEIFDPLREVWSQDPALISLHRLLERRGPQESAERRRTLREALTVRELWARSYAQWVATKSSSPVLLSQVASEQKRPWRFGGALVSLQWEGTAFGAIMAGVDKLMEKGGLR